MPAPDAFLLADELHGIPQGGHAHDAQRSRGQVVRGQQGQAQEAQAQDKEEGRGLGAVPIVQPPYRDVPQGNRAEGEHRQREASPLQGHDSPPSVSPVPGGSPAFLTCLRGLAGNRPLATSLPELVCDHRWWFCSQAYAQCRT